MILKCDNQGGESVSQGISGKSQGISKLNITYNPGIVGRYKRL